MNARRPCGTWVLYRRPLLLGPASRKMLRPGTAPACHRPPPAATTPRVQGGGGTMEAVGLCWSHPGANLPAAQRRLWQSGGHGSRAKQSLHRPSLLCSRHDFREAARYREVEWEDGNEQEEGGDLGSNGTLLASRVVQGVSEPLTSCGWNLRVFPEDAWGCQCPFVLCLPPQGCLQIGVRARRRQWHPTPVLLPGDCHGQRSLVGCSPWGP